MYTSPKNTFKIPLFLPFLFSEREVYLLTNPTFNLQYNILKSEYSFLVTLFKIFIKEFLL